MLSFLTCFLKKKQKSQPRVTAVTDLLGGQLSLTTFYFLPFTFKSQRSSLADANSKATS